MAQLLLIRTRLPPSRYTQPWAVRGRRSSTPTIAAHLSALPALRGPRPRPMSPPKTKTARSRSTLSSSSLNNGHSAADADFSRPLLAAMVALRDGDFSVRLPVDLTGLDGKIADTFNDIVALSDRRAHEAARVSRMVGKEGKLKERMSLAGMSGARADEVAAI